MRRIAWAAVLVILVLVSSGFAQIRYESPGGSGGTRGVTTLTEASATALFDVGVPSNGYTGMDLSITTFCSDGSDHVALHQIYAISCINDAGSEACTASSPVGATAAVAISFSAASLTFTYSGTNTATVLMTATCSAAQTILQSRWEVRPNRTDVAVTPK